MRDHGRGIPDIEKARQPMFTTGGEERSGMGFTIMESFMDRLVVRSTPGRGTTVVMRSGWHPGCRAQNERHAGAAAGGPGGTGMPASRR